MTDIDPKKLARTTDVETSHIAARTPGKEALRVKALKQYAEAGDEGLVDGDLGNDSLRRRGSDLRGQGWTTWKLDDNGQPVRRTTPLLGGSARVAVITPKGLKALAWYRNYHGTFVH